MLTTEYIDATFEALQQQCPLVAQESADSPVLAQLKDKIVKYDAEIGQPPPAELVCNLAQPLEAELQSQATARAEEAAREVDRQRRRELLLSPSDEAREAAIEEFRANQPQPVAREFKPRKEYSQKEQDAMDSETYRREILGDTSRVEDKNRTASSGPDRTLESIRAKRIMKDRKSGDAQMRAALRRALLEKTGAR